MIDEQPQQISQNFFSLCPDLAYIAEPFPLSNISQEMQIRDLQSEFQLIRALTQTKKHKMKLRSNSAVQIKKNRYPEQAIYEHSRIVLQAAKDEGGYVNANFIPCLQNNQIQDYKIILTQGPVDNTIGDFNKMLEQEKIQCVVMLCRLMENGKSRCSNYIGGQSSLQHDKFCDYITTTTISLGPEYQNYQYEHVYYSEWPDRKVPSQLSHISELIKLTQRFKRIVIHCSAGLGRSGVIAALLLIIRSRMFVQQKKISIFEAVRKMREYRFGAVQNSEQYAFLYLFFKEHYESMSNNE